MRHSEICLDCLWSSAYTDVLMTESSQHGCLHVEDAGFDMHINVQSCSRQMTTLKTSSARLFAQELLECSIIRHDSPGHLAFTTFANCLATTLTSRVNVTSVMQVWRVVRIPWGNVNTAVGDIVSPSVHAAMTHTLAVDCLNLPKVCDENDSCRT